jgi:hypothetical protein
MHHSLLIKIPCHIYHQITASRLSRRISDLSKERKRSLRFTLVTLIVVRHLQTRPPEAALDVEALVGLAAIEDALVTAHLGGDEVERLNDAQPELLPLLVFCDGDVLDVTYQTEAVDAVCRECQPGLNEPF